MDFSPDDPVCPFWVWSGVGYHTHASRISAGELLSAWPEHLALVRPWLEPVLIQLASGNTLIPAQNDKLPVTGAYDVLPERIEAAKEAGLETYESFEAVLADEKVEVVLIATPNDSHKDLAIAALRAGKHVVCEKPVAMNVQELDEILAVAKETGKTFMVHQNRRWDPDFLMVRETYQAKTIGDIFQIESRVQGANGIPGDWRHLKEHGGGMLLDWGVHLLDQLLWLVDSPIQSFNVDFSYVLGDPVDDGFFLILRQLRHTDPPHNRCKISAHAGCA